MLDWIKSLFISKDNLEILEWRTDASIYKFLTSNIDGEGRLNDGANYLPDEKPITENEVRWAPGLLDSMFGAQDSADSKLEIEQLIKLLKRISEYGDKRSEANFYQLITETDSIIGIIDGLLERAINLSLPINPFLFDFSKDLALKTNHRNSVKVGVALIGICKGKSVLNEIKIIGLHDEFTLFSIVVISNISNDVVSDFWGLAKKVDGWGKIHIVERLAKMELSNAVKNWLITDGYKNSIMYEYLAYSCAVNGNLHEVLKQESVDPSVFNASADIIAALITGGPAEDISHYQFASILIENFVHHAKVQTSDLIHFIVLNQIKDFLTELQNDIEEQSKNGWTQDIISNCLIDIMNILSCKNWSELALTALCSKDNITFWNGKQAAKILQMDIWEIVWQKLKHNPENSSLWYDVVNEAKPVNVDEVIQLAIDQIPLKELATGPKDSLGLGPEFIKYQALDYIITFLENYPTKGEPIIIMALDSPITRNRNMAIKALYKWTKENWSQNISNKLNQLSNIEPNSSTKESILRVLNDQELDY